MSYSSPKINKRSAGKGNKTDSPKIPKGGKRKGLPITTAPMRVTTRSPTRGRTTVSVTIENRDSDVDGFAITAYLPQSGWKKLKLQATPGMTVQEVVEAELPEVGQIAYQVYQFPSRALLNPEREVTVLKNQEISIEPMQTSMSDMQEDPRLSVVKELLASEDNYLENLKSIFDTYAEPLKSWGVGPSDMKILFDSVGKLCDILMNFFSELEIAVSRWCPWTTRIGGLFKLYPKFWVLYEEYSTKYPDALRLLRWKQDNDPAFVNFLNKKRGAARHTLESLMLLPVHRVWEYDRLLSQLMNLTPDSHPDYPDLHSTVIKVHMMVQSREDYLNFSENMSRITQVQSRFPNEQLYLTEPLDVLQAYSSKGGMRKQTGSISPSSSRVQSTSSISCVPMTSMDMADSPSMSGKRKSARLYIQEGPVSIIQGLHQQDRYMFLFDDLLLIAKSSGKPSSKHKQHKAYRLKHRVRVSEMWISECVDEVTDASISLENAFVFGWPTCNLVAAFSTTGERELWKGLFTKHIDMQQQLIEPKTLYIHISNEVDLASSMGPPETLEVDYNETVRDVLAKALEIFRISESAYSFQLWVKLSRTDDGYPLIGHEFPYAIHLSSARNDQGMDSNTHVQFVIRRRQRSVEPSSTETTPSHHVHTKRPYNIRRTIKNLPWTKWKKQREIVKPKVKFFGTPLQLVMPEGRMPRTLQALLSRMYVDGPLTHGILRKSANAQKVRELKAAIDNGQQVDVESVATHVVAALFKEFLRNIPGGLLPSSRYTVLVASNDCKDIDDRAIRISREVDKFAVENRILVTHVIPLLHHISRFNATNAMSTTNIAICLAPSLLWPDTGLDVIMNEVPPLVQFLIEHSPKIFGPDLPELFENLPPPASDFDPSTTDNTPPVTLVPTKKEDGSNKKITTRIPISISSEESFHSQGDTSLSDDSLGETQVHSDSTMYEDSVPVTKKRSKHIAQGGRGSVILSGQSIASLHQDTDEDEDDILPLPKVLQNDAQSDEDMCPTGVRTFSNHWRRAPPHIRQRNKSTEESRRRSHIGLQHEPLTINTSISPSGSQSSSSPNLSPKESLREKRVQSDTCLDDNMPVRRRNKRGGNTANGRPVGIIEVQQHSPYSSGSFITTGPVTERFRNVTQYPSTYSFDSLKSSSSEERARTAYNSSVTEKDKYDKYTTSGSPKTNFRKRFEVSDRSIAFDFPKRRSFRGGNKEKRSRKAARSQSMKETLRPESLIVNVHYHTTSSSYDDLTKFKRGQIGDYAAPVQAGEGPVDDFPESEQNLRNLHNGINKPATYQSKEVNRPFPLKIQNSQQNTSPRASRLLPDNEETKLKMVSTLKQKAIAKLARTGSTQQSPTDTTSTNTFSGGLQRKSLSSISPIERKSPPTHRYSSNFNMFLSAGGNNDRIEPCRITRRYAGQPRSEPKRKSLVDGIAEEKREPNRDWKSQAPTMAEKKKVWQEFISKPSAERLSRIDNESGGTVKAELDAANKKLQASKQEITVEETKPKPTMHHVSKFVTTATPRVAIRQVVVKSHVLTKSKPRKIIFYPPRRIVEVYK